MPTTTGRLIHDLELGVAAYVGCLLILGSILSWVRGDVLDDYDGEGEYEDDYEDEYQDA